MCQFWLFKVVQEKLFLFEGPATSQDKIAHALWTRFGMMEICLIQEIFYVVCGDLGGGVDGAS